MIKKYKHWVFDLDGTLVDTHFPYMQILKKVFSNHGLTLSDEAAYQSLGVNRIKFLSGYVNHLKALEIDREIQEQSSKNDTGVQVFPGIFPILDKLEQENVRLGIWTGRDRVSAMTVLHDTGLHKYFEICIGNKCVLTHKPHPEGLFKIMKEWQSENNSTIMIGDHDVDVQGALAAKISVVRVGWAFKKPKKCTRATYQFHEVDRFGQWVQT